MLSKNGFRQFPNLFCDVDTIIRMVVDRLKEILLAFECLRNRSVVRLRDEDCSRFHAFADDRTRWMSC